MTEAVKWCMRMLKVDEDSKVEGGWSWKARSLWWQMVMMKKEERKRKLAKEKLDLYIVVDGGRKVLETLRVLRMVITSAVLTHIDMYLNTKAAHTH